MMTRVYSRKGGIEQLALEQLRRAAQAAERILDLVRQLPDHQPAAAELRHQRILAGQAPVLGDVLDLEQQPRHLAERHLRHGAVEDAIDAPGSGPGQLALHDAFAAQMGAFEQTSKVSAPRASSVKRRPSA